MSESAKDLGHLVEQYLEFRTGAEEVMRKYENNPDLSINDMTFAERVWLRGYQMLETEGDIDDITQRGEL